MLQKKYEDYLDEMYSLFPHISEDSIKHIIDFGLKKIYNYVKSGNDIMFNEKTSYLFIGNSSKESGKQWGLSMLKEHTKIRRLFLDKKESWDKYHYFGLTEEENKDFKDNSRIVTLYKLKKECSIRKGIKYVYRINLNYPLPDNKILWREDMELSIKDCEEVLNFKK